MSSPYQPNPRPTASNPPGYGPNPGPQPAPGYPQQPQPAGYPQQPGYQAPVPAQPQGYPTPYPQGGAGQPYPPNQPAGGPPGGGYPPPTNGLAVAAMVCGILGFFTGLSAIPAVICGHMALHRLKTSGEQGRGMALTGVVTGYIVIGMSALSIFVLVLFWGAIMAMFAQQGYSYGYDTTLESLGTLTWIGA